MIDVFGTLGPFCENIDVLEKMFSEGMTGIRINLSHVMLKDYAGKIDTVRKAAGKAGIIPKILIDMQGPEIRIGDLGNSMPLWKLPKVQKTIAGICNEHKVPFMVVTQMLTSMEHSKVPTRAEVTDIYNAVLDGAHSVMVTGETAIGENPIEVIKYLARTARAT